ncbi:hypothetical protein C7974DRAFT_66228 [Boeremia exigua]|uniref:uncharacterized protein n=1 Tax=Boeremia exigua TaxID=749465 RepID=UPI001E8D5E15|nr:uncharacterized protein C7974DRAFT_66228 [Boeremia exigua]KAH6613885.1 hypothetical protein C7974DRAFT_66228 [Boeremia exigua]
MPRKLIPQMKRFMHVEGVSYKLYHLVNYGIGEVKFPGGDKFRIGAVVCHVGGNTTTGHYYALTQDELGVWWRFDDSRKWKVDDLQKIVIPDAILFFVDRVSSPNEAIETAVGSPHNITGGGEAMELESMCAGNNAMPLDGNEGGMAVGQTVGGLLSDPKASEGATGDEEHAPGDSAAADAEGTTDKGCTDATALIPDSLPTDAANDSVVIDNGGAAPPASTSNTPSIATSTVDTITRFASRLIPSWREKGVVSDSEESTGTESVNVVQAARNLTRATPAGTWGRSTRGGNSLAR